MKIGILITARMGSTRLPDKHLRAVSGRPVLSYLLDRIEHEFKAEIGAGRVTPLLVTGSQERNSPLATLCSGNRTQMFYGDDNNVPRRHLQAAGAFGLDAMVSVDGDDVFCSPEAMRAVYTMLSGGAALAKTTGLPLGMNSWGYSRLALERALAEANLALLETGWGRIFEHVPSQETAFACPGEEQVRATLDYDEDLRFFTRAICEIDNWAALDSASLVRKIILKGINAENLSVNETYWENFANGISKESDKEQA